MLKARLTLGMILGAVILCACWIGILAMAGIIASLITVVCYK